MFGNGNPEVLVVGAGPVGQFAALLLARNGVRAEIVDTGIWACTHSYALALHPDTLRLLDECGLARPALESAYPVRTIGLYEGAECRARVELGSGGPLDCLAVARQDALEGLLEKALEEAGVRIRWRHEAAAIAQDAGRVKVRVDRYEKESRGYIVAQAEWVVAKTDELEAPFVIGADGYNSRARRALDLRFPETGPAQYYAVFEFKTNIDLKNEVRIVPGERTTDVLWPLPGGGARWSFELPDYSDPAAESAKDHLLESGFGYFPTERFKDRTVMSEGANLPVLSENSLHHLIEERAPWFRGSVDKLSWRIVVRFERRLASAFGAGRVWLAGDAAHLAGPAGIQSMNAGLFEAHDLAAVLTRILRGGAPLSDLDAYGRRWMDEWRKLQGLTGGMKPTAATDPWVARHAAPLLSCLPGHGPSLTALAAQLGLEI
jgi:NADPH-dependent dioxygenase